VVLGPSEARFEGPRQIREWTILATVDKPASLAVLAVQARCGEYSQGPLDGAA
jgi:hypothetical protein